MFDIVALSGLLSTIVIPPFIGPSLMSESWAPGIEELPARERSLEFKISQHVGAFLLVHVPGDGHLVEDRVGEQGRPDLHQLILREPGLIAGIHPRADSLNLLATSREPRGGISWRGDTHARFVRPKVDAIRLDVHSTIRATSHLYPSRERKW
jgi:hypothetical protein